ncbi:hypothetical protein BDY17DRAFT_306711 [Neohortaea acidophila]|uniref:Nuclear polyadenylated RNA-binding protein Nab2 n=1 Tax=Neohortaea acidophila TaxID=245834 RepID=A0A6A6Q4C8_9PEZI|nr:uncharacterized protein BDY17DRAFT_306711 [Neohortaea acidophila]KAF2487318.1 hypothetical protein BDY17DRAFT_306711 [Neohortaea acidophila]
MAALPVEAGSALAQTIQNAVQPKLMEYGWVAEENDTTLSEYVTTMLVNGKDIQGVVSELGGDLLGVGEDDPSVTAFAKWLFDQLHAMNAPPSSAAEADMGVAPQEQQQEADSAQPATDDSQMDDAALVDGAVPSGPKAMRNGPGAAGRGRGSRMLGQLNNHLNRENSLPDSLRRIKGAAGGAGRINAHANRDPPRGPRQQNLANGVQRMMNGAGRGGRGGHQGAMNPAVQANAMMNQLDPQQQMAFMQMMEMQATMMQQMLGGQAPPMQNGQGKKSLFERVDRKPNGHFKGGRPNTRASGSQDGDASGMDVDAKKEPFETVCRFNINCTNPACPYAHQSPAAPPGQSIDLTDTCTFGAACQNNKCSGRHPSPAQRTQHLKQEVDCKFFPNCTNPSCPFKHPDMPLCRNGADCAAPGCKFTHSKIMCRYTPCTKPNCPFKHIEGQRGVFKDKVWTATDGVPTMEGENGGTTNGATSHRFAGFSESAGQAEELILPGQQQQQSDGQSESQPTGQDTQITT